MMQQISVFLENRVGQLAEITAILAENNVDMRAIHIAEAADYGVLRMIASDPRRAAAALSEKGFVLSVTPVAAVAVPDRPGGLHEVVCLLTQQHIDINYMYSAFGHGSGKAYMIFRVDNPEALVTTLTAHGYPPADSTELGCL